MELLGDPDVEDGGLDLAAPPELQEQPVLARPRETVGEGDRRRQLRGRVLVTEGLRWSEQRERSHGDRARRVNVREDTAVSLEDRQVTEHAHVELEVRGGLSRLVLDAEAEPLNLSCAKRCPVPHD